MYDICLLCDGFVNFHSGGNGGLDQNGHFYLKKNQTIQDVNVSSLLASEGLNVPIGVIIGKFHNLVFLVPTLTCLGDRCEALNRKLPHRYNVMDWFRVTDIWAEKVTGKTGYKVRLEKIDLAQQSWWSAKGTASPPLLNERDFETKPESQTCKDCSKTSLRVYDAGWMCLNHKCGQFWLIDGAAPVDLTFHSTFLNYRKTPNPKIVPKHELVPHYSTIICDIKAAGSTIREAWRGIVCPNCSQCITRVYWEGWKCTNCNFEVMMKMVPLALDQVIEPDIKRKTRSNLNLLRAQIDDHSLAPYIEHTYTLPRVGSITHFVANDTINSKPNGPNDMFVNLQRAKLGLKRYPLSQAMGT